MLKKLLIVMMISSPMLFAKTFNLEALYGFGWLNTPQKGTIQEGGLRAIFYTENFTHEVLGRMTFGSNTKVNDVKAKYSGWEAEYRFGARMDEDMAKLGMLAGSAYLGLGYQSVVQSVINKTTTNYIYLPFGFWGEDSSGLENLKIRYGLNFKAMFFNDNNDKQKLKWDFLLGGKVYAGVGYNIGNVVDIFAQLFFTYNAPIKNLKHWGLEAGLQF
ncbi:hypothetical protein CCY99_02660 [Helicobacter sp. 16-1353]|uniref:hypothetical protein n=1 Tax=Helicobacter sp. 16-1353 TaxID=2004996 RepID=UPI000DCBC258|nr:hypothetical protein [Helicobacter sp. 16-1353]RAX54682.1 hypothetical protein CCY99_02660 [Helicobacter sp. 16-1353]